MIVCICNNVSDRAIRQAVNEGVTSMVALRSTLNVGTCCGKCHSCAKQVLRECLSQVAPVPQVMVFHPSMMAA